MDLDRWVLAWGRSFPFWIYTLIGVLSLGVIGIIILIFGIV